MPVTRKISRHGSRASGRGMIAEVIMPWLGGSGGKPLAERQAAVLRASRSFERAADALLERLERGERLLLVVEEQ